MSKHKKTANQIPPESLPSPAKDKDEDDRIPVPPGEPPPAPIQDPPVPGQSAPIDEVPKEPKLYV